MSIYRSIASSSSDSTSNIILDLQLALALARSKQLASLNTNLDSYDNKLISSTLSNSSALNNEPASPISSVFSSNNPPGTSNYASGNGHSNSLLNPSAYSAHPYSNNANPNSGGKPFHRSGGSSLALNMGLAGGRTVGNGVVQNDTHPSHPNSPWTMITLTVLPMFNGTPLLTPIEDLNALVSSHISSSMSRSPRSYRSLLSSDLQDLISSGMVTLKAKLDPLTTSSSTTGGNDPAKLVGRVTEVWNFLFGLIPYIQGIFLPISLLDEEHPELASSSPTSSSSVSTDVRHLLLSGFLVHILLPIVPKLIESLDLEQYGLSKDGRSSSHNDNRNKNDVINLESPSIRAEPPTSDQLGRLQHMALILATQAKPSSFFTYTQGESDRPPSQARPRRRDTGDSRVYVREEEEGEDERARDKVEDLLRAVVRLKNGGEEVSSSRSFVVRGSNVQGMVPQPRRRGYFPGVALRRPDSRMSTRGGEEGGVTMERRGTGVRTMSGGRSRLDVLQLSMDDRSSTHSGYSSDEGTGRRDSYVDEFGAGTTGHDQTSTVTDLGRKLGQTKLRDGEETLKPSR